MFTVACIAGYAAASQLLMSGTSGEDAGPLAKDGVPWVDPDHPCGPTALSLAAQICGRDVSLQQAVAAVVPDRLGRTSIAELVDAAEQFELAAFGVHFAPERIVELSVPVIMQTRYEHFVVAIGNGSDQVLLLDPPHKVRYVSSADIRELCTGRAILVAADAAELDASCRRLGLSASAGTSTENAR